MYKNKSQKFKSINDWNKFNQFTHINKGWTDYVYILVVYNIIQKEVNTSVQGNTMQYYFKCIQVLIVFIFIVQANVV